MSDVRLSNASPTVERVDPRPQESARPSVSRALFGRPEPGTIQSALATSLEDSVQGFRERYNFDPVSDRPLPGDYEWEVERDAPDFYRRGVHVRTDTEPSERGAAPEGRSRPRKRPSGDSAACSSDVKKLHDEKGDRHDGSPPGAEGSSALVVADEPEHSPVDPSQS